MQTSATSRSTAVFVSEQHEGWPRAHDACAAEVTLGKRQQTDTCQVGNRLIGAKPQSADTRQMTDKGHSASDKL